MLRVGLAGFGYWGPNLARALNSLEGAQFAAIAENSPAKLSDAKEIYGNISTFQSVEDLIESSSIDALVIAMPANTHEYVSKMALDAGLHVLVEKPMVFSPKVGIDLEDIAKRKNLVFMPGHTFIYNDAVIWAKNYINEGRLGDILNLYSQRLNLGQLRRDVNVIWNLAPHDVAMFDFLLEDRVRSVSATGSSFAHEGVEDLAFLSLTYRSGVIAHTHVSWLDPTKTRKITIMSFGTHEELPDEKYIENLEKVAPTYKNFNASLHSGEVIYPKFDFREPLKVELQDFVDSILLNRLPQANSTDGIWVARVLQAADASIRQSGTSFEIG